MVADPDLSGVRMHGINCLWTLRGGVPRSKGWPMIWLAIGVVVVLFVVVAAPWYWRNPKDWV
jgi:hypothetical protein